MKNRLNKNVPKLLNRLNKSAVAGVFVLACELTAVRESKMTIFNKKYCQNKLYMLILLLYNKLRRFCMATSSIFNTVSISSKKQAKDFVSILEKSEKQNTTLAGSTAVNTKPSDTTLKNLLKKRFVLK